MIANFWRAADPISRTLLAAGLSSVGLPSVLEPVPAARYLASPRHARALLKRAKREQMIPMLARHFGRDATRLADGRVLALTRVIARLTETLFAELDGIAIDLARAGLDFMLVKGGDLALRCYPADLPRTMRDLDLLVRRGDVADTVRAFIRRGFVHGELDRRALTLVEIPAAAHRELVRGHYELLPLSKLTVVPGLTRHRAVLHYIRRRYGLAVRGGHVHYMVSFDVHFNLSLGVDEDVWWRVPRLLRLRSGAPVQVLDPADLLWFLAMRLYAETMHEDEGSLRGVIDVAACLARFRDEIDWARVKRSIEREGVRRAVDSVGAAIDALTPGLVPEEWSRMWGRHCRPIQFVATLLHTSERPIARGPLWRANRLRKS